jgi:NADP-dependent 3-hydroxy acid dehydrogenase YdfG
MGGQRVYAATKASWTCLLQHLASEFPVDEVQIINVHPGGVYTETISQMMTKEVYDWDDGKNFTSFKEEFLC